MEVTRKLPFAVVFDPVLPDVSISPLKGPPLLIIDCRYEFCFTPLYTSYYVWSIECLNVFACAWFWLETEDLPEAWAADFMIGWFSKSPDVILRIIDWAFCWLEDTVDLCQLPLFLMRIGFWPVGLILAETTWAKSCLFDGLASSSFR